MQPLRAFAHLTLALLCIALQLVLLPLRLTATLAAAALLLAGLVGFPAWLIQLAISAAGEGSGHGGLHTLEMCLLLAAGVPVGMALLWIANIGLPTEADDTIQIAPAIGRAVRPSVQCDPAGEAHSSHNAEQPDPAHPTPEIVSLSIDLVRRRLVRHEVRLRVMSRRAVAIPRRRRGEH